MIPPPDLRASSPSLLVGGEIDGFCLSFQSSFQNLSEKILISREFAVFLSFASLKTAPALPPPKWFMNGTGVMLNYPLPFAPNTTASSPALRAPGVYDALRALELAAWPWGSEDGVLL